jgi:hypothetical protein
MRKISIIILVSILILSIFAYCNITPENPITVKQGDAVVNEGATIDIGEGVVNDMTNVVFTIENISNSDILLDNIDITGEDITHFSLGDNYNGSIIGGNETMDFILIYKPLIAGEKSATITLTLSDDTQYSFNVAGTTPSHEWSQIYPSGTKPIARSVPYIVYAEDYNAVILFAGRQTDNLNDTWMFDLSELTWTEMISNDPDDTSLPQIRRGHTMAYLGNGNVLMFGGSDSSRFDDTWVYNIDDNQWTEITPTGDVKPDARVGGMMGSLGDGKAVLYGGSAGSSNYLGDVWIYDHSTTTWTEETFATTANPQARSYGGLAVISDNKFIIFGGGAGSTNYLNDTWEYDISTHEWAELSPSGDIPDQITYTALAYDGNDTLIHFGGLDDSAVYAYDTWEYSISNNEWTHAYPTKHPQGRGLLTMCGFGPNKVLLFGGLRTDSQGNPTYFNDLQEYYIGVE